MRWSNVWTIFGREVRDQVRDRRTLFMVFVLPILLYPILGLALVQFTAAFEQKPRVVVVVGAEHLPAEPALLDPSKTAFLASLFDNLGESSRMEVVLQPQGGAYADAEARRTALREGKADAIVLLPPDVADQLRKESSSTTIPIAYDSTKEPSQITYLRVREVLARWKETIVQARLAKANKPANFTAPVASQAMDVASSAETGASLWGRLFPFLLVIMALTGAFYPAIDLCAGEKERGTMETLLICPASRTEIVLGKFFTVMLASVTTALLNIVSMALTGLSLASKAGIIGSGERASAAASIMAPPTPTAAFWMVLLLIPVSIFFSAICLALAVLAKSMKEGQYYMTPLYLVSLPLIFLTLMPGIELNLFYSLVPITGVSLLLRALILGEYQVARQFFIPVLVPTIIYGLIALRWAVDQFEREDVLFRESERFDVRLWLRHLVRDREPTPSGGQALFCFLLMICLSWFVSLTLSTGRSLVLDMALGHLLFILLPPLVMTFLFTSSPSTTLKLKKTPANYLVLAAALAVAVNPLVREFSVLVNEYFPVSQSVQDLMKRFGGEMPNLGVAVLVFALIPSITEEVAFRGFILSGLLRGHKTRSAIVFSAFLFGSMHVLLSVFQQLFPATLLGLILGLLAVRSGSLFPGIVFHFLNNTLAVLTPTLTASNQWMFRDLKDGLYARPIVATSAVVTTILLVWLYQHSTTRAEVASPSFANPV